MANQRTTSGGDIRVSSSGDVRIRSDRLILADSAYISAGGSTATTARLTAPAGKSSGSDFQAGKISDDTNPLPSLDLGSDKYTELEWAFTAVEENVVAGEVYELRVSKDGVALDTYTVTPTVTIAAAARAPWHNMTRVAARALAAARL